MSILKKLGETAKSTASTIGSKSSELVNTGKQMVEKKQLEGKIQEKLTELGGLYYEAYSAGRNPDSDKLTEICEKIKDLEGQIAEIGHIMSEENRTTGGGQ